MNETDLVKLFVARVPFVIPNARAFQRTIIDVIAILWVHYIAKKILKTRLRSGIPGHGDVWVLVRGGRHIEIEAKAAKGRMRDAQVSWKKFCDAWGIDHLVLRARAGEEPNVTVERWCQELRAVVERS